MRRIIFLILLIFISSCENPPVEEYNPELNVFCLLNCDITQQSVRVARSYKMDENSDYDLEDVEVILSGEDVEDTLITLGGGIYVSSDYFPVEPNKSYQIEVAAKGMNTVTGHTTVPGDFYILYPEDGDTLSSGTMETITIRRSENARGYYIMIGTSEESIGFMVSQDTTQDSIISYSYLWINEISGPGTLKVAAVDTNYFNYYHKGTWEEDELRIEEGIEGGLGVFGSAVVEEKPVYIK